MSAPAQFTGLSAVVRRQIPNLCPVPLSVADQELVDNALAWMAFISEHREKSQRDELCPKCGLGRMQFYQPKSRYECAECSYVEPAPKTGSRG